MKRDMETQTDYTDPFDGRFQRAKEALGEVLRAPFSGSIQSAMHIGNTAMMALRMLDGTYNVSEVQYKVTTENESH